MKNLKILTKLIVGFAFIIFLSQQNLQAQQNNTWIDVAFPDKNVMYYNSYKFVSDDMKDFFHLENGNSYPSTSLFDGFFKTCWVCGSSKESKNATLYIRLPDNIELNEIIVNIFGGYGKSEKLFYANARPKKISLAVLAAVNPDGYVSEVAVGYKCIKFPVEQSIILMDTFGVQSFPLHLSSNKINDFKKNVIQKAQSEFKGEIMDMCILLRVEIKDVYPGTKYDDICISEIFLNDKFITPYPDRYNEIMNVYIKNDNTLLTEYANGRVFIIKDTTSVFTMVDWPKSSNWAILLFVKNDEVGEGSRVEEHYSLIDLKHGKIVDAELEKCTGISPMFQTIEKEENGKVYINNYGKYKIELK